MYVYAKPKDDLRLYSKSSLTLNEWRFNLSFPWVSMLFLNSWRFSVIPYYVTTHPPAIQKQRWPSREAQIEPQIEPPLFECEWAFIIQAVMLMEIIVDKVWILAWHACCSLSSVKQTHLFKTSRFVCNYLQIYTDSKCGNRLQVWYCKCKSFVKKSIGTKRGTSVNQRVMAMKFKSVQKERTH